MNPTPITDESVWVDPNQTDSFSFDCTIGPILIERWVHRGQRRSVDVSINLRDNAAFEATAFASQGKALVGLDISTETADGKFSLTPTLTADQAREVAHNLLRAAATADEKTLEGAA